MLPLPDSSRTACQIAGSSFRRDAFGSGGAGMSSEFLLYQTPDGQARIQLRVQDGTVWLTQKQLTELYQVSVPAIALHIRKVFQERELSPEATVKEYLIVTPEGARNVERRVAHGRMAAGLLVICADTKAPGRPARAKGGKA